MRLFLIISGIALTSIGGLGAWYAFGDALGRGLASGIGGRGGSAAVEWKLLLFGALALVGLGLLVAGLIVSPESGGK